MPGGIDDHFMLLHEFAMGVGAALGIVHGTFTAISRAMVLGDRAPPKKDS